MPRNKSIIQVASGLLNTPLLIHVDTVNTMLGLINQHAGLQITLPGPEAALTFAGEASRRNTGSDGIAVIPIHGVLSHRADAFMEWFFGDTSYEGIRAEFRAAMEDPTIRTIVLDVDSPGGVVNGCFDLADEIYQARGTKPIFAVVNESAFSGAYALASAADKVYVPRSGGTGSIGVLTVHLDQSKYDERIGATYSLVYAGAHKADFNRHAPLSPEALGTAQARINDAYELFVKTVARNRGMTPQAVRDTEAALYFGTQAVAAGLADSVMSWTKAMDSITTTKQGPKGGGMKAFTDTIQALFAEQPEQVAGALAELGYVPKGEGASLKTEELLASEPVQARIAEERTAAEEALQTRVIALMEMCALADMGQMALGFIRSGTSLEAARDQVMAEKAAAAERTTVRSTIGALSTGAANPLLENAKKRANVH